MTSPIRFFVDEMLFDVAKYLRVMGYDARFPKPGTRDSVILRQLDSRILITSDREFCQRATRKKKECIYIEVQDSFIKKLAKIFRRTGIRPNYKESRCPHCNVILKRRRSDTLRGIEPIIKEEFQWVYVCPKCGHIYWKGKQWRSMTSRIRRAMRKARL